MSIEEKIIIDKLNSIPEDEMTEKIILPLYIKKFNKTYYDIEFTGGKKGTEQGCDITYYEITHDTKAKEYSGIQVKQGDIGKSKNQNTGISAIEIQAQQAFARKMNNTKDKAKYYIKTFIIMTTGEILADARSYIVDRFADKNIRFITGKDLAKWINELFDQEFIKYFHIEEEEKTTKVSLKPEEAIIEYLENNFAENIESIQKSFRPYGALSSCSKIIIFLLENGQGKSFQIARETGMSKDSIDDYLRELKSEDIVEFDEDGAYLSTDCFNDYLLIKEEAEKRIIKLGYTDEVNLEKIMRKITRG